jgi:hypothetical protein
LKGKIGGEIEILEKFELTELLRLEKREALGLDITTFAI